MWFDTIKYHLPKEFRDIQKSICLSDIKEREGERESEWVSLLIGIDGNEFEFYNWERENFPANFLILVFGFYGHVVQSWTDRYRNSMAIF
jgi:hypothetical protein